MATNRALWFPLLAVAFAALTGCAKPARVGTPPNALITPAPPDAINWPPLYKPTSATFFVQNKIAIKAPPEVVWEVLIEAGTWPEWHTGAKNVRLQSDVPGKLSPGAVLDWRIMGFDFISKVHEFEPPYRLAWETRRAEMQGYHAWLIVPTADGCWLFTDETQFGFFAMMQRHFQPLTLWQVHEVWLAAIKERAECRVAAKRSYPSTSEP
jgi:uncharacterized protein YndB with AHSA1/START domain